MLLSLLLLSPVVHPVIKTANGSLNKRADGSYMLTVSQTLPDDTKPRPDLVFRVIFESKLVEAKAKNFVGRMVSVDGQVVVHNGERIFRVEAIYLIEE